MAITKTYVGLNENGSPHFSYVVEGDTHAVVTGPVYGTVTLPDGTTYDVSDDVIEVASLEHAGHVAHAIGVRHQEEGHPHHDPAIPFVHACTETCPDGAAPAPTPVDALIAPTDTV